MSNEIRGTSPSGTLYARIINPAGLWWNGTTFEAYSEGNYANYVVTMTEQGTSTVYVADFPSLILISGTYDYFVHRQAGGSPAAGDVVVNTGKQDWSGTASISASTGSMSGADWLSYFLRQGFKRTDKATEVYECTTDAIQEMRRKFMFDEAEAETTTTDTIAVLGDFKLDIESDFGLLLGVVLEDDDTGTPLNQISKAEFDQKYASINVETDKGYPLDFTIYAGQIYIGPIPDQTSYSYRLSYSRRAGTITSTTTGVPFTQIYRDLLAENVNHRMWSLMEEFDKANYYRQRFEASWDLATRKERVNSGVHSFTQKGFHL